jgi:hypothetical protein
MVVDFYGYTGDCTVSGQVELGEARLAEYLEKNGELIVKNATLNGLNGEHPSSAGRLNLWHDDIYAAEARAPRSTGDLAAGRRIHTVRHVVRMVCGPYTIFGELHALPGARPLESLLRRRSMVPLTDCVVLFARAGTREVRRAPVVVVNGALIDAAEPGRLEDLGPGFAVELVEPQGQA